jgi:hypothetical protein
MQLTPNPAPLGTNLLETDDGAGGSWKSTFDQLHGTTFPPYLVVVYTGTLPLSFPQFQIAESSGNCIVSTNGNNPIIKLPGVAIFNNFTLTDALGLLTSLEFSNISAILGFYDASSGANVIFAPNNLPALTSLSLPMLTSCGGTFNPGTLAVLTTLSIPALNYVGGNFIPSTMALLTTLSAPELLFVGNHLSPATMASLTTFNFPKVIYVGGSLAPTTMASLTTISLPLLKRIGINFSASGMASLTTISLPAMIVYGGTITANSSLGNLASVTLGTPGTLKLVTGATINISGQKLDQASVNGILALLVSLDGTGGTTLWGAGKTVNLSGGTSAAPSGQGIIDKATLIARTATVTTN